MNIFYYLYLIIFIDDNYTIFIYVVLQLVFQI